MKDLDKTSLFVGLGVAFIWASARFWLFFPEITIGLSYFFAQFFIYYGYFEYHNRKLEYELGTDYQTGERYSLAGLNSLLFALIWFSAITIVLLLSQIFGFKIDMPLWALAVSGLLTGGFGASFVCLLFFSNRSTKSLDEKLYQGWLLLVFYTFVVFVFLHFLDNFL